MLQSAFSDTGSILMDITQEVSVKGVQTIQVILVSSLSSQAFSK